MPLFPECMWQRRDWAVFLTNRDSIPGRRIWNYTKISWTICKQLGRWVICWDRSQAILYSVGRGHDIGYRALRYENMILIWLDWLTRQRTNDPCIQVCWAVLTLSLSRCNQAYQFYIIRLLIGKNHTAFLEHAWQRLIKKGLCESGYYPGIQHSLGSWYRRDELGKRACIFQICSAMGQMASGYIMGGVYQLGGVGGYRGWQWFVHRVTYR